LIGGAVLLVLALAAGPAAAAMIIQGGRGTGFVKVSVPPAGSGSSILIALVSMIAVAVVAGGALAFERRSNRRLAVAAAPADNAGHVCNDVVCQLYPSRPEAQERKAA